MNPAVILAGVWLGVAIVWFYAIASLRRWTLRATVRREAQERAIAERNKRVLDALSRGEYVTYRDDGIPVIVPKIAAYRKRA